MSDVDECSVLHYSLIISERFGKLRTASELVRQHPFMEGLQVLYCLLLYLVQGRRRLPILQWGTWDQQGSITPFGTR